MKTFTYNISIKFTGEVEAESEEEAIRIAQETVENDCRDNSLDWYLRQSGDTTVMEVK